MLFSKQIRNEFTKKLRVEITNDIKRELNGEITNDIKNLLYTELKQNIKDDISKELKTDLQKVITNEIKNNGVFPVLVNKIMSLSSEKLVSIGLSSLLIISEALPFFDDVKSNGILDILRNLNHKFDK